jgi:uncharacterized membrane protein YdjX (TVP38/TMEM64 family)
MPADGVGAQQERLTLLVAAPTAAGGAGRGSNAAGNDSSGSVRLAFESAAAAGDGDVGASAAKQSASRYLRLMLLLCLVLVSAAAVRYLDAAQLELLVSSLQDAPVASMLVSTLLFGVAVVALVPGMLLSIASGAAHGWYGGTAVAFVGTVGGQVGAFLLGRYLLRDMVVAALERRVSRFRALDAGISEDGFKLVLLLRLSPVLPYNLM